MLLFQLADYGYLLYWNLHFETEKKNITWDIQKCMNDKIHQLYNTDAMNNLMCCFFSEYTHPCSMPSLPLSSFIKYSLNIGVTRRLRNIPEYLVFAVIYNRNICVVNSFGLCHFVDVSSWLLICFLSSDTSTLFC